MRSPPSVGVIGLGLIGTAVAHWLTATGDAPQLKDVSVIE